MLDRASSSATASAIESGIPDRRKLIEFLVSRQFAFITKDKEDEDEDSDDDEDGNESFAATKLGQLSLEDECLHVGFNGRLNKTADSCYTWWVSGTLEVLHLSSRKYRYGVDHISCLISPTWWSSRPRAGSSSRGCSIASAASPNWLAGLRTCTTRISVSRHWRLLEIRI